MTYTVYLSHSSIGRSPEYKAVTIDEAKEIGDREFGGGFNDHKIVVANEQGYTVATRLLGDDDWSE